MFTQTRHQRQSQGYPPKTPTQPKASENQKVQGDPKDIELYKKLLEHAKFDDEQIMALQNAIIIKDATSLSSAETDAIKLSKELNLFDRNTLLRIYEDGKKGTLPIEIDAKLKVLQIRLRDDGKYEGPIDGIFGIESVKGIEKLLSENDIFHEVKNLSQEFKKIIYERVPIESPNYNRSPATPGSNSPPIKPGGPNL